MKVLVVDDNILFRQGLISLLEFEPDFQVVGEAGSAREAIEKAEELCPEMILMDFGLPDGSGSDAARKILAEIPDCKIIILTIHAEDKSLIEAIRGGVKGYLLKNVPIKQLTQALRSVMHGEAAISRSMMTVVMDELARASAPMPPDPNILEKLSLREIEVLRELTTGRSNEEIARRLYISKNTVRHHVHNLLDKLDVENRNQLAKIAKLGGLASQRENPPANLKTFSL